MSRQHGAKVLADMALRKELKAFGVPLDGTISPEQVLLHMVREAAGNVAFLGARMAELSEASEGGDSGTQGSWRGRTITLGKGEGLFGPKIGLDKDGGEHVIGEEVRAATALYGEWSDRLVKYAKTALDAGIAKAQVELARTQGQTIVVVVNRVLVQIGLGEEQQNRARELLAEEFRLLAASPTELLEVSRD